MESFIKGIIKSGHHSVLEHISINFELQNISRACATQILRHRLASYSCESMRYVDMCDLDYVTPAGIEANEEALAEFNNAVKTAANAYKKLLSLGVKKEDARACLPIATCTRMFFTFNLREILHFLNERMSVRAQREIRLVALNMYCLVKSIYPWLLEGLEDKYLSVKEITR